MGHAVAGIDAGFVSKPEVEKHDAVVAGAVCLNKHVLGREVSMHDPGGVYCIEARENLIDDVGCSSDGQRSVLTHNRPEGATLVEFHQDKRSTIGQTTMSEDGGDVWVNHASGESDFSEEPPDNSSVIGVAGMNGLQSQALARLGIAYGVHDAHAARAHDVLDDEA